MPPRCRRLTRAENGFRATLERKPDAGGELDVLAGAVVLAGRQGAAKRRGERRTSARSRRTPPRATGEG